MDAVWADDFHHQVRRAVSGETDGYYADYTGSSDDIAETLRKGWYYCGQPSPRKRVPRGTDPTGVPARCFVICIQNHDQIGNRAFGERLSHQIDRAAFRAASALLLCSPQTPLIFMGQEWATTAPFQYFTDHNEVLGALVTEGRRREFRHFSSYKGPNIHTRIPDPQAESTFLVAKLNWEERDREPHAATLRLYHDLLALRKADAAMQAGGTHAATSPAEGAVALRRTSPEGVQELLALVALRPGVVADLRGPRWSVVLTTEDDRYSQYPRRPTISGDAAGTVVHFPCPAAVVFRRTVG
jgi:maltooligosyltrehalose trehalohydrolase